MTADGGPGPVADGPAAAGLPGPLPEEDLGALLVLTSTELEVLEAAHLAGLTDRRPAGGGEAAAAAWVEAIRSLTARGLLARDGRIREDDPGGELVQTVLDVRLGAATVVVVERLLGSADPGPGGDDRPTRDLRLLHVLPVGAVVEDVHPDGVHGFDLVLTPDLVVRAVTDLVVPPLEAVGAAEQVRVADVVLRAEQVDQLPARLGHPTVLAELTLLRHGDVVEGHLLALGPRGCWAARRGPGPLRFRRVLADVVASVVAGWLEGVGGTMAR